MNADKGKGPGDAPPQKKIATVNPQPGSSVRRACDGKSTVLDMSESEKLKKRAERFSAHLKDVLPQNDGESFRVEKSRTSRASWQRKRTADSDCDESPESEDFERYENTFSKIEERIRRRKERSRKERSMKERSRQNEKIVVTISNKESEADDVHRGHSHRVREYRRSPDSARRRRDEGDIQRKRVGRTHEGHLHRHHHRKDSPQQSPFKPGDRSRLDSSFDPHRTKQDDRLHPDPHSYGSDPRDQYQDSPDNRLHDSTDSYSDMITARLKRARDISRDPYCDRDRRDPYDDGGLLGPDDERSRLDRSRSDPDREEDVHLRPDPLPTYRQSPDPLPTYRASPDPLTAYRQSPDPLTAYRESPDPHDSFRDLPGDQPHLHPQHFYRDDPEARHYLDPQDPYRNPLDAQLLFVSPHVGEERYRHDDAHRDGDRQYHGDSFIPSYRDVTDRPGYPPKYSELTETVLPSRSYYSQQLKTSLGDQSATAMEECVVFDYGHGDIELDDYPGHENTGPDTRVEGNHSRYDPLDGDKFRHGIIENDSRYTAEDYSNCIRHSEHDVVSYGRHERDDYFRANSHQEIPMHDYTGHVHSAIDSYTNLERNSGLDCSDHDSRSVENYPETSHRRADHRSNHGNRTGSIDRRGSSSSDQRSSSTRDRRSRSRSESRRSDRRTSDRNNRRYHDHRIRR